MAERIFNKLIDQYVPLSVIFCEAWNGLVILKSCPIMFLVNFEILVQRNAIKQINNTTTINSNYKRKKVMEILFHCQVTLKNHVRMYGFFVRGRGRDREKMFKTEKSRRQTEWETRQPVNYSLSRFVIDSWNMAFFSFLVNVMF